jgi:hypothetical protein
MMEMLGKILLVSLYVGNSYDHAWYIWGSERICIRLDLSGFAKGKAIVHATLRLWQYYALGSEQEYEAYRVVGEWSEAAQDWENQRDLIDSTNVTRIVFDG